METSDRGKNFFIVTIIICIFNLLIFGLNYFFPKDYYLLGGMNYEKVVVQGEYSRFLTCMYLHGDVAHIGMNLIAIAAAGSLVESYLGSLKMIVIYLLSGLGGSILSLVVHSGDHQVYSIGASGAAFGLLVASAIIQNKKQGRSMVQAILFVCFYAVATWSEGIDLTGHMGGAVLGAVATLILSRNFREDDLESLPKKIVGCIVGILVSLAAVWCIYGG